MIRNLRAKPRSRTRPRIVAALLLLAGLLPSSPPMVPSVGAAEDLIPDPREMGYEPLTDYCPRRRLFIAVSSCEKRPRHALYALPERCGLRFREQSRLLNRRPNPVRPGPIATLRLKWVPEPWSPETGQVLVEHLTVDVTAESAEIVSIETRPFPESRD